MLRKEVWYEYKNNKTKENRKKGLFGSILLLLLGIILITNSNSIVTFAFQIIGAIVITYGIFQIIKYLNLKKQFKIEDSETLMSGIIKITIGLLIILLASILEVGLRYILGIYLIMNGINKLWIASSLSERKSKFFINNIVNGSIFILLGLYTILIANAALVFVGILLIISAIFDIFSYSQKK